MAGSNYAQDYFVFIQADNKLPFYVRLGSQVYSSSAGGHLILSQLKDSTYHLIIGLPGQTVQEQPYSLAIQQKDRAFLLKEQGEKGWGLYDEQTWELKSPEAPLGGGEEIRPAGIKKDDAFSRLMAGVVHDTAVLYNTYAMEQVLLDSPVAVKTKPSDLKPSDLKPSGSKPADSTLSISGKGAVPDTVTVSSGTPVSDSSIAVTARKAVSDSSAAAISRQTVPDASVAVINTSGIKTADPKPDTSSTAKKPLSRSRTVVKLSERKLPHTLRLAYADHSTGKKADTIILFIPVDTPVVAKAAQRPPHKVDTSRIPALRGHGPNPDSPLLGQSLATRPAAGGSTSGSPAPVGSNAGSLTSGAPATETPRSRPVDTTRKSAVARSPFPFVNSDCHNYATDYDVDKLRVKLLEGNKDEDRIQTARKVFKTRCFSTRQIRALSEVFTTDAAKFRFFETAYPFCSDDQFRELSSLLADPVYKSKFRAMIEH